VPAHVTATRPHSLLHEVGIENGERQCRDCSHDGDVDPELDDVDAARCTEQGRSQHDHEYQRLDGGLQSDRQAAPKRVPRRLVHKGGPCFSRMGGKGKSVLAIELWVRDGHFSAD
jgi:hypothetical protein